MPTCPYCDYVHEQIKGREDEFEYINTNTHKENNRELYLQSNQVTEHLDKSSSNFSKLEQDIYSIINLLYYMK